MRVSMFKPYSYGYVVSVRDQSPYVEVCPIEPLGFLNGEVNSQVSQIQQTGTDGNGNKYQVTLEFSNCLPAKWLPGDTQRLTPPDVRVGEQVMIYRCADTDQFYWKSLGLDNYLRRLETVIYAFSATTEDVQELTPENSYFFEVSTHAKHVNFSTSKANGEPFAYTIQINTEKGVVTIKDDDDNIFFMDSSERHIKMKNADGSFLSLNRRNGHVHVPDTYKVTCTDYVLEASDTISEKTQDKTVDASNSISEKTTTHTLNASASSSITTSRYSVKASVAKITAVLTVTGAAAFKSTMTVGSNMVVGGMITGQSGNFIGMLFSMGKNVGGVHTHASSGSGIPN